MSRQAPATGSTGTDTCQGLERLLVDVDVPTFLSEYLGEQMLHVQGASSQWAELFSWQELNTLLSQGFISHPRARLVRNGVDVDADAYTFERGGRRWLDSLRCQRMLAEGASLILTRIESANSRLETFVRELERDLHADVRVDVIATCVPVPGLKIHWDNAECFNLQLDGEKTWQVVRPERPYPLTANERFPQRLDVLKPTPPETAPAWSGTLSPGDLIYLPRGWWHTVTPLTVPSLHLSIAADIPTLSDFVLWFARQSPHYEMARRNLPVWHAAAARQDQIASTLGELAAALSAEAVERFIADFRRDSVVRPAFALPAAGSPEGCELHGATMIRTRSTQPLLWTLADGSVTFDWQGHPHRFDARLAPLLEKLETKRACYVDDLIAGSNRFLTMALLQALIAAGVVEVT
jgi:ribosomal protein L16 Arg81 hydroxylase